MPPFQYPQLDRFRGKEIPAEDKIYIFQCFSILNWIGLGERLPRIGAGLYSKLCFSILNWIGLGERSAKAIYQRRTGGFSILNWIGLGESFPLSPRYTSVTSFSILNWIGLGESCPI